MKTALETGDYSQLFPPAISFDQRYALPSTFLNALQQDAEHFETIGYISNFKDEMSLYNAKFEEITGDSLTLR